MELGGNAPFIVFDDADLEKAVEGALIAKFRNSGQTCVCANRFYIQDGIYERLVARFAERVDELVVGRGDAPGTQVGPMIDGRAASGVERLVGEAVEAGARVVTGRASARHGRGLLRADLAGGCGAGHARGARGNFRAGGADLPIRQ